MLDGVSHGLTAPAQFPRDRVGQKKNDVDVANGTEANLVREDRTHDPLLMRHRPHHTVYHSVTAYPTAGRQRCVHFNQGRVGLAYERAILAPEAWTRNGVQRFWTKHDSCLETVSEVETNLQTINIDLTKSGANAEAAFVQSEQHLRGRVHGTAQACLVPPDSEALPNSLGSPLVIGFGMSVRQCLAAGGRWTAKQPS